MTLLIKKGAGRRPAPQNTREAPDDKRITRRREKHQMRKVDSDKEMTLLIKKGTGRRPAPQNTREASDDKGISPEEERGII